MNSLTNRNSRSVATAAASKPRPEILSLPPAATACLASATEGGLPILRRALPVETRSEIHRRMASIEASLSEATTEAVIVGAVGMLSTMPRRGDDRLDAEILLEVWLSTMLDTEMVGVIPAWAVTETARAFVSGSIGAKWMPSVGEFVAESKRRMAPARAALVEMRRIMDAPVEVERSEADRAAMRDRVAEIMAGLSGEKKEKTNAARS